MDKNGSVPTPKRVWVGYYMSGFVTALLLVGGIAGVYWYFQPSQGEERLSTLLNPKPEDKQKLIEQAQDDPTYPTPTPPPPPIPMAEVRLNLTEAVSDKKYALLTEYLESEVEVIIPATKCCGKVSAQEAMVQMDYINNALRPWVFDDSNPKIAALRTQLMGFDRSVIGISANNYAVVFGLSSSNRIEKIRLSIEYGSMSF